MNINSEQYKLATYLIQEFYYLYDYQIYKNKLLTIKKQEEAIPKISPLGGIDILI